MSSVASLVRPIPKPRIDPADIIDVNEAAALYLCSVAQIYKLVENRKIPHYRVPGGRALRFLRGELLDLLAAQRQYE